MTDRETKLGTETEPGFTGPPEPINPDDGPPAVVYPTTTDTGEHRLDTTALTEFECQMCGSHAGGELVDGEIHPPHECPHCERDGPWQHPVLSPGEQASALRATGDENLWRPPTGVSHEQIDELWDDVREYIHDHWATDDTAIYDGLTAYALSTWFREELDFLSHLMVLGKTRSGKTRLLKTLARVSYRTHVSASTSPSAVYRLIDEYNSTFFVSEYHGMGDARQQLDRVVRAGQKRGEYITRNKQTSDGDWETTAFDAFSHVGIATQYNPDDDIVNRCIQVHTSPTTRDMPMEFDRDRADDISNRLLYARFSLLESGEWADAKDHATAYLAERDITGRPREKLLGLVTVADIWDRLDAIGSFVETVVSQDEQAAADSQDARLVEVVRDLAFDTLTDTDVLADDPFGAIEIPHGDVAARYETVTGVETSNQWVGQLCKRLDIDTQRTHDGTVISDPELGPKLRTLCDDLTLGWNPTAMNDPAPALPPGDSRHDTCNECGRTRSLTNRNINSGGLVCPDCADDLRAPPDRGAADD